MKSSTTNKTESLAFDEPETTSLGQTAASIAAKHNGESGFLLLDRGRDALSWRLILADAAEKSIDVLYFLLKEDGKVVLGDKGKRCHHRAVRHRSHDNCSAAGESRRVSAHP